MSATAENLEKAGDPSREIVASRIYNAPRELVWKMWTDPQHIARWWGPKGFRNTIHEMDVRPGGHWRFVMHGPDGRDYDNHSIYIEVVEPERLAYDHVSGPLFHATATFEAEGSGTKVTMQMVFESAELRNRVAEEFGAVEGLQETLGRLEEELANDAAKRDFVISRTFDAPRYLVWRAWTEPERMGQWFGPKSVTMFHSENDLRAGGVYHYGMRTPEGAEIWGKWTYREVAKPQRLVFVATFSDANGGVTRHPMSPQWPLEMLSTITFDEQGGRTTVTVQWEPLNATEAERKVFEASQPSMQQGWSGTFESLERYLGKEQQ
jgi:uncharacterized protein YndB with AHSA1/START domain